MVIPVDACIRSLCCTAQRSAPKLRRAEEKSVIQYPRGAASFKRVLGSDGDAELSDAERDGDPAELVRAPVRSERELPGSRDARRIQA